jgi:hypothetical protein
MEAGASFGTACSTIATTSMLDLQPLNSLQESLAPLFGPAPTSGFCHRCERVGPWDDRTHRYRCRHCGGDPLAEAPAAFTLGAFDPARFAPAPRRPGRRPRRPRALPGLRMLLPRVLAGLHALGGRVLGGRAAPTPRPAS